MRTFDPCTRVVYMVPWNLGPYHAARYAELHRQLPGLALVRVGMTEVHRPWSAQLPTDLPVYDLPISSSQKLGQISSAYRLLNRLAPRLVLVVGYVDSTCVFGALWSRLHGAPPVLVSDSTALDHPRHRVKESAKRALVSGLFTAAFVAGRRSAEYVADLGIKPGYIWRGVDVVDNDHFAVAAEVNSRVAPSFLAVTRLSPEKDLPTLIEAFRLYRDAGGSWDLRIAGTGPQETELRNAVSPNLIAHVHWLGWVSYEDLPGCYHSSNCLVLPSVSEPWGLVVNEAMAAGLPVLVSERCGCVPELCHEGVNGFAFNPGDAPRLADLMLAVASDRNRAREMGEASRRIIASFSIEASARAVVECVSTLLTS